MTTLSPQRAPGLAPSDRPLDIFEAASGREQSGPSAVLEAARRRAQAQQCSYAGAVTPPEAWALFSHGHAALVDVRTEAELRYVGRVPGARHAEWHGKDPEQVSRFLAQIEAQVERGQPVLLLCRSGVRSHHAALILAERGYAAYNILEGFEGQRDAAQQRGFIDGWRRHKLPWIQD